MAHVRFGQALADVATIAVLEHRAIETSERIAVQLQIALSSRIAVEQAKASFFARAAVTMGKAFELIRNHARSTRRPLSEVATDIAAARLSPDTII